MRWKISVLLIVAMLCVALTGMASAEDIKCCWEKPCGTKVVQCDKETTFVLYPAPEAQIVMSGHGYWYVDMDSEDGNTISFGDIRLTGYHDNYEPNTKVLEDDGDNGDPITVIPPQDIITYLDIINNGKFDLHDPVYIDLDNSSDVTKDDIRITDVPPVDVYDEEGNLMYTAGQWDECKWTQVNGTIFEEDYLWPLHEIGSGIASDLLGWMDGDCSGDWNCADKLYINQPTPQPQFDDFVTIGDVRLYVPPDECIPDCGTKVQQGDKDAVYALMVNTGAKIAYYTLDPKEIYIDMDDNGNVSFGDIRLTNVSTHYGPNTKVKVCDYWDLGHPLEEFEDQHIIRYHDLDGLAGYTLGDPLYVDADDDDEVSDGDIRLTKVPPFDINGIPNGSYGLAWSVVKELPDDPDVGWDLENMPDGWSGNGDGNATVNELLGYIDSDCSGDWTCPDKMYLQQLVNTSQHDLFVTIGDLRLYIPDETSPFYDSEWPECGTKVVQCNIDLVYALMNPLDMGIYPMAGFVDKDGQQGFGLKDNAYLDMDENELVSKGDIRLTNVTTKYNKYEYNTKVVDHDEDIGDILNYDNGFGFPLGVVFFVDLNWNGVYDVNDPLYLDCDWLGPGSGFGVTQGDIRLTDVPVFGGTPHGYAGQIGTAWSRVVTGDLDINWEFFRGSISSLAEFSMIGDFIMIFDADCSGTWTCVDKLYLQQQAWWGDWWFSDDPEDDKIAWDFVTVGDLRLYMPPCDNPGDNPGTFDAMVYDTQNPHGVIDRDEVFNAIDDYFTETITRDQVFAVIAEYFK